MKVLDFGIAAGHPAGDNPSILLRCLRRSREERFESMAALAQALRSTVAEA